MNIQNFSQPSASIGSKPGSFRSKRFNYRAALEPVRIEGLCRVFGSLTRSRGDFPMASWSPAAGPKREVTVWCTHDYLGQGQNALVIAAMQRAIDYSGSGSGGTPAVSGATEQHLTLESELADLHGKAAALVFTSGYLANEATISALRRLIPGLITFTDEFAEPSTAPTVGNEGSSRKVFRHGDLEHLEWLLRGAPTNAPKLVALESVCWADGGIADIGSATRVAKTYGALSYLDESHAVGMYGATGGGISERDALQDEVDIIEGSLGKAFGVMGGYVAGDTVLVDAVRLHAAGFISTTSLPPVLSAGALASVRWLKRRNEIREQHRERVTALRARLFSAGLLVPPGCCSHIVPVRVGDPVRCQEVSKALLSDHRIIARWTNSPAVGGADHLRFTPTPFHTDLMMEDLIRALKDLWDRFELGSQHNLNDLQHGCHADSRRAA